MKSYNHRFKASVEYLSVLNVNTDIQVKPLCEAVIYLQTMSLPGSVTVQHREIRITEVIIPEDEEEEQDDQVKQEEHAL